MTQARRWRDVHGVVLLDKPAGLSSNQALQRVRRLFQARKAGHTGSLDPLATGLLPICLGEASKTSGFMLDADKHYVATLRLGTATTTADAEGETTQSCPVPDLDAAAIRQVLAGFAGEIEQVPPMYSALKVDGKPLYRLARQGEEVERKPRRIRIFDISLADWNTPDLRFEVHCSKGTYVRTLGEDIARELGSCGHLVALRRTGVGVFDADRMADLETLERAAEEGDLAHHLLPPDAGLADWPIVRLEADSARRFSNGNAVSVAHPPAPHVRVFDSEQRLLGLGEVGADGLVKPRRVFNL